MADIDENVVSSLIHNANSFVEGLAKKNNAAIPDGKIEEIVRFIIPMCGFDADTEVTEDDIQRVVSNFETKYKITMQKGTLLPDPDSIDKKWYFSSKAVRGSLHWDGYERYLSEDANMPPQVIAKIDGASEEIMDVLGDPLSENSFHKKGLVIGSVQSGKTSNYIAPPVYNSSATP